MNNPNPTKEAESYAKKQEVLQNLWFALKDRYTKEIESKELNTNDGDLWPPKR